MDDKKFLTWLRDRLIHQYKESPNVDFVQRLGKMIQQKEAPDLYGDIRRFHEKFSLDYDGPPRDLPEDLEEFRIKFMQEELDEYADPDNDLAKKLDALVDLVYVALGTAYMAGFDFNEAWRRVQAANMAKVRTKRPEDSKRGSGWDVVKPEGWTPPDLTDLVVGK